MCCSNLDLHVYYVSFLERTKLNKFEKFQLQKNFIFFESFRFCVIFRQFPAFFDFLKILKNLKDILNSPQPIFTITGLC